MTRSMPTFRLPRRLRRQSSPAVIWAREAAASKRRALEDRFAQQIKAYGLPTPEREFLFHPTRRWRFDFAWPQFMVAVEVDGAVWTSGRHTRGKGFEADAEKLNAAQALGWRVYRYTATRIRSGCAVAEIRVTLERAAWNRIP